VSNAADHARRQTLDRGPVGSCLALCASSCCGRVQHCCWPSDWPVYTSQTANSGNHFSTADVAVGDPGPGQIMIRNTWLSVDPYMRGRMNDAKSYSPPYQIGEPLQGGAVGEVIASNADKIPVGATVMRFLGWREYAIVDVAAVQVLDTTLAPAQAYLGALGMVGLTAYTGLKRIASVKEGDVVFVSGAAGAVGIIAARVAKHLGAAKVIGSVGGPLKAKRLVEEFSYDAAVDYKAGDLQNQLAFAAPDGIDVYFDNVGGDHLRAAIDAVNSHGRIAMCGAISVYNATTPQPGPDSLYQAIGKRLTLRGLLVGDHHDLAGEYSQLAAGWLKDGSLRYEETIVDGIDNTVEAFLACSTAPTPGRCSSALRRAEHTFPGIPMHVPDQAFCTHRSERPSPVVAASRPWGDRSDDSGRVEHCPRLARQRARRSLTLRPATARAAD
jgi:NADPH-dependent curcumin reductase CurA